MEPDSEEAMTKEELEDAPMSKNAFTQLMSARPRALPPSSSSAHFKDRLILSPIIADPASFPPSSIIYFNDDFVAIRDKFPKATIHTLLLPRSRAHTLLHPFDALSDEGFLAKVRAEAETLRALVGGELQRQLGSFSRADAARQAVLNGDSDSDVPRQEEAELPRGRDWVKEVMVGIHAVPSLGNLHIHVLTRDMHSGAMKHRKHYNSFNTPFFVPLEDFPLGELDPRRDPGREGYLRREFRCWRCGQNFGNRFRELKAHLDKEFEAWKRE